MPRVARLTYSNWCDFQQWQIPIPNGPSLLSRYWASRWLTESSFPKQGKRSLYLGMERNVEFENDFLKKQFSEKVHNHAKLIVAKRSCAAPLPPGFELMVAPLIAPLDEARQYDVIYCDNVLHALPHEEQWKYLSAIEKSLTPEGIVCISVPYLMNLNDEDPFFEGGYYPPNISLYLEVFGSSATYNSDYFPGGKHFSQERLAASEDLITDRMSIFPGLPQPTQSVIQIQIGLCIRPSARQTYGI